MKIFFIKYQSGSTRCLIVIIIGNKHDDPSSSPGQGRLHFT